MRDENWSDGWKLRWISLEDLAHLNSYCLICVSGKISPVWLHNLLVKQLLIISAAFAPQEFIREETHAICNFPAHEKIPWEVKSSSLLLACNCMENYQRSCLNDRILEKTECCLLLNNYLIAQVKSILIEASLGETRRLHVHIHTTYTFILHSYIVA